MILPSRPLLEPRVIMTSSSLRMGIERTFIREKFDCQFEVLFFFKKKREGRLDKTYVVLFPEFLVEGSAHDNSPHAGWGAEMGFSRLPP